MISVKRKEILFESEINPLKKINDGEFYGGSRTRENERTKVALDSYLKYKIDNIEIDESYDCLINKEHDIRLTADILTNPKIIEDKAIKLEVEENQIIKAFNEVVYTIGNCCPAWKNPASGQSYFYDNIWYKLNLHIVEKRSRGDSAIPLRNRIENRKCDGLSLNRRSEQNHPQMFSIFDGEISWETLISNLYLQDYFDYNWNLVIENDKDYIKNITMNEKEEFINFVLYSTILIVQRGYRIATEYKGNRFNKEQKEQIISLLKSIGIESDINLIYSNKKKVNNICLTKS